LENNETTSYFFWRRKRSKKTLFPYFLAQKEAKTSTPSRPSPILEGSTQENAETAILTTSSSVTTLDSLSELGSPLAAPSVSSS
jgi:hypothetical protein